MNTFRMLQLGCIGLALNANVAFADRALQLSTAHLVAESALVKVTHDHDVRHVNAGSPAREIVLSLKSTLRIVRKSDNVEVLEKFVMPLTALVSVDDGRYFAGLSNLRALSGQYNFLLVSANGQIVTTALITPKSGHCRSVSWTTTNFIRWYDEKAPDVRLTFVGREVVEVAVMNPYDGSGDGLSGKCVIRLVDSLP